MRQEQPINEIRNDMKLRNRFIEENEKFILLSASKVLGRYVGKDEDAYSIALMAFDEAISKYDSQKGGFSSFAALLIKNRLIDEMRKTDTKTIPFSGFYRENEGGDEEEIQIVGQHDVASDTAFELETLKRELAQYGISMFDIPKSTPKSKKTKKMVFEVLQFVKTNEHAKKSILKDKELPSKLIFENTDANKKLLERHRKYIIVGTIILNGDYPIIAQYIKNVREV